MHLKIFPVRFQNFTLTPFCPFLFFEEKFYAVLHNDGVYILSFLYQVLIPISSVLACLAMHILANL